MKIAKRFIVAATVQMSIYLMVSTEKTSDIYDISFWPVHDFIFRFMVKIRQIHFENEQNDTLSVYIIFQILCLLLSCNWFRTTGENCLFFRLLRG